MNLWREMVVKMRENERERERERERVVVTFPPQSHPIPIQMVTYRGLDMTTTVTK
jgi:hypothetical protein